MCPSKCASTCASLTEAGQGQTGGDCPGTPHGGTPGASRGSPTGGSKRYVPPTPPIRGSRGAAAYREKVQHHWVPASHGHGHGQDSAGRHRKTKLEGGAEAEELT